MIEAADIEDYKAWRRESHIKEVTIRHDLHALSAFLKFGLKRHWLKENPLVGVDIPSDADAVRMHVLSAEEEKAYFDGATKYPMLHDLAQLILNQGMRPEEAREMRKIDVDLVNCLIHIPKGKTKAARRLLSMVRGTREILERRMFAPGNSIWVFPSSRVPGAHVGRLNFAHDAVCAETGLSFCLYDLRHTFATRMAQAGVDLATLAAILGHSSLRLVMRYVHPQAEHMKAAMARYDENPQASDIREAGLKLSGSCPDLVRSFVRNGSDKMANKGQTAAMVGKADFATISRVLLEARVGIEPTNKGFADLSII